MLLINGSKNSASFTATPQRRRDSGKSDRARGGGKYRQEEQRVTSHSYTKAQNRQQPHKAILKANHSRSYKVSSSSSGHPEPGYSATCTTWWSGSRACRRSPRKCCRSIWRPPPSRRSELLIALVTRTPPSNPTGILDASTSLLSSESSLESEAPSSVCTEQLSPRRGR